MGREQEPHSPILDIEKGPDGKYKRVWIEQPVVDPASVDFVKEIQVSFGAALVSPLQPEGFHMTLAHIGKPQELYREFLARNPKLSFKDFMTSFGHLLESTYDSVSQPTTEKIESIKLFKDGEVAVLLFENSESITQRRGPIIEGVRSFVRELGVVDRAVDDFLRHSPNLGYTLPPFKPHITLGYSREHPIRPDQLPNSDVGGREVILGSSRTVNVSRR